MNGMNKPVLCQPHFSIGLWNGNYIVGRIVEFLEGRIFCIYNIKGLSLLNQEEAILGATLDRGLEPRQAVSYGFTNSPASSPELRIETSRMTLKFSGLFNMTIHFSDEFLTITHHRLSSEGGDKCLEKVTTIIRIYTEA